MGFVGGGGNIATATALPHHLLCIVLSNQIVYGFYLLIFMLA